MISERLFKKGLNAIVNFIDEADYIAEATDYAIDLNMYGAISQLEEVLSEILSYCVKDNPVPNVGTDIEYFLYELHAGKNYAPGMVEDEYGNNIDMSSIDAMWKYFKDANPDIEDIHEEYI